MDAYLAEPPLYPPLCGKKMTDSRLRSNLMSSFVSMGVPQQPMVSVPMRAEAAEQPGDGARPDSSRAALADIKEAQTYGEVLGMSDFLAWLSART